MFPNGKLNWKEQLLCTTTKLFSIVQLIRVKISQNSIPRLWNLGDGHFTSSVSENQKNLIKIIYTTSNALDVGKYQHFRGLEDHWSRTGIHTTRTVPICRGNQEPIKLTNFSCDNSSSGQLTSQRWTFRSNQE